MIQTSVKVFPGIPLSFSGLDSPAPLWQRERVIVFLNGQWVQEEEAVVSIFDRGFLYGDGIFETLRVSHGRPFRFDQHWRRFQEGIGYLALSCPGEKEQIQMAMHELAARNALREGLIRLTLSRGRGARGYSPKGTKNPTLCMTSHPLPANDKPGPWKLVTSRYRVAATDPLASLKTCNKLLNVLARDEAESAGAGDALLLNHDGEIAETASANLFWIRDGALETPRADAGLLPGITRAVVLELAAVRNLSLHERTIRPENLLAADGVFLSLTSWGIVEVSRLDNQALRQSPIVWELQSALNELVARETGNVS